MTVSVASRPIHRRSGLSESGRIVLDWIDRGPEWLDWAIDDPHARYHFEDESALVAGIQCGLHASPYLLLPTLGLMAGPAKLMTLTPAQLRTLKSAEGGDTRVAVANGCAEICTSANRLVTFSQLDSGTRFLQDLGVGAAPLFQVMDLEDRLAIYDLFLEESKVEPSSSEPQQEAAAFAVDHARTAQEFGDYYLAYRQYDAAAAKRADTAAQRTAQIDGAIEALLAPLFHALDCPRVDGPIAPWEVAAAIEEWLAMGRRLGFSRLSQGVQQVIAHTDFAARNVAEAPLIVATYLAGAQALLLTADLDGGAVGQDGASRTFTVRSSAEEAEIALGPDGIITLSAFFRTAPTQPAVPTPAKGG